MEKELLDILQRFHMWWWRGRHDDVEPTLDDLMDWLRYHADEPS